MFLMIRNSFNLYQQFSQSFHIDSEEREERGEQSSVNAGLFYKNN